MKKGISEINAGSVADIAFLLLIFFLVSTTLDVDQGIARSMPRICNDCPKPPIIDRNVLKIAVNRNDEIRIEDESVQPEDIPDKIRHFYTANSIDLNGTVDMPKYDRYTIDECSGKLASINSELVQSPKNNQLQDQLEKWQLRLAICQASPSGQYTEIDNNAVVQLISSNETTYARYLEIQNAIKKVVNELRQEHCERLHWGDYFDLNENNKADAEKIKMLRILVPEHIVEPLNL